MKIRAETISGKIVKIDRKDLKWRLSVYGILIENAQILFLKNVHNRSKLFLPGGEIEIYENIHQALKREFIEETGIEVEPTTMVYHRESMFKGPRQGAFHSIQLFFIVKQTKVVKNKIADKYVGEIQWYPLKQLPSLPLASQIKFLKYARVLDLI